MPLMPAPYYSVNDNVITLFCSDGDGAFRPTPSELNPARREDGTINYFRECKGDDETLKLWKCKIGTFLAESVLHLPRGRKYYLSSLPRGYGLFVHVKGDKDDPRHDSYLRGSSTVTAFRSPAEFIFHAKWILLGCPKPIHKKPQASSPLEEELFGDPLPEEYTDRCACKYCAKISQSYISTNFSNYHSKKSKTENKSR
ncbi:hypothetical protein JB92DRAFT_3146639 [Gautieria morchelliformis]|nr:hypothetical protein JB92DRAFT_3146639 [Gautieria morchelliformis]